MKKQIIILISIILIGIMLVLIGGCTNNLDKCDLNKDGKVSAIEKQKCEQPTDGGTKGKCGDGICGTVEKERGICPEDCEEEPTTTQLYQDSPFGAHGGYMGLSEIGIKYKRSAGNNALIWDLVEPELDTNYKWDDFDKLLEAADSFGLKLMVTIIPMNTKDQISCGKCSQEDERCKRKNPCSWEKYSEFLTSAINRYKDRIKYWQIENEPAAGHYYDGTSGEYAELLLKSYKSIKDSCSDCKVIIAGMADYRPTQVEYYKGIFSYLKNTECAESGCFDIFDFHTSDYTKLTDNYDSTVSLLSKYGYSDKPIWSTEFGPLHNTPACEAQENKEIGDELIKSFVVALDVGFEKLFWRTHECPSWIINKEGEKTNAYYAYKTLINKIEGFDSVSKLAEGQYKFKINEKDIYVLWCDSVSCSLPSEIAGELKVTDYYGNEEAMSANKIILSESPIFAEIKS